MAARATPDERWPVTKDGGPRPERGRPRLARGRHGRERGIYEEHRGGKRKKLVCFGWNNIDAMLELDRAVFKGECC